MDDGGARITNREIYDQVLILRVAVDEMKPHGITLIDHEARIRRIESRWLSLPVSVVTTLIALTTLLYEAVKR